MEKSSFFNSVGGDRVYKAEEWAEYFASFIGNGVFPIPSNGLQVEANGSAGIVLRAGRAWINGYFYFNTDDLNMELNTADGVLNRIDRIVIRWDLTTRTISAVVKSYAPSNNPTAPALQRDADAYELCLADVYVRAGSTAVLQSDITDQRYNSSLCGIVTGTVDQIDASALSKQFNDYAELFKEETKLDFEAWFEEIRGILSEDLAGSLALAIDDINQSKAQPNGIATLNASGKLAQMPTAADVGAVPTTDKGKPGGVATLNGFGELYQMPSAFAVNAISSRWIVLIMEDKAVPNKYSCDDYTTPGDVISIANYAAAQSFANLPEAVPGKLYTLPLRTDDQGRNDLMQEYHTITGNVHCRSLYYYSGNKWAGWDESWITPTLNAPFGCTANEPVRYRKDNHMVTITGWLTNIRPSSPIFKLPVGFRPTMESSFCVPQSQESIKNGFARIEIYKEGTVYLWSTTSDNNLSAGCALNITFMTN